MLLALTAFYAVMSMAVIVKNRMTRTKQEIDNENDKLKIESLCNREFMLLMPFPVLCFADKIVDLRAEIAGFLTLLNIQSSLSRKIVYRIWAFKQAFGGFACKKYFFLHAFTKAVFTSESLTNIFTLYEQEASSCAFVVSPWVLFSAGLMPDPLKLNKTKIQNNQKKKEKKKFSL